MTLMKPFLIGLTILMLIIGLTFLILYLVNKKRIEKTDNEKMRNQKLNLYLAILILIGATIVGSCIFLIY